MIEKTLPNGLVALLDDEDGALLAGRNWHADKRSHTVYVRGRYPGEQAGGVYLHNLVVGGLADHKDGNGLDCRRSNLRKCTQAQNGLNRKAKKGKRFKGVFYDKRRGKYYAQVALRGAVKTSVGTSSEEEAARFHDALALEMHGEFAKLNFPLGSDK